MQGFLEQNEDEMGRFMSVVAIHIIVTKVYDTFYIIEKVSRVIYSKTACQLPLLPWNSILTSITI